MGFVPPRLIRPLPDNPDEPNVDLTTLGRLFEMGVVNVSDYIPAQDGNFNVTNEQDMELPLLPMKVEE